MGNVPFGMDETSLTASTPARPIVGARKPVEGDAEMPPGPPRTLRYPEEPCPSCGYDMTMITVAASFLLNDCEDVNYRCEKCCAQVHRQIRSRLVSHDRPDSLAQRRLRT